MKKITLPIKDCILSIPSSAPFLTAFTALAPQIEYILQYFHHLAQKVVNNGKSKESIINTMMNVHNGQNKDDDGDDSMQMMSKLIYLLSQLWNFIIKCKIWCISYIIYVFK